jgi:hypothetical protein
MRLRPGEGNVVLDRRLRRYPEHLAVHFGDLKRKKGAFTHAILECVLSYQTRRN